MTDSPISINLEFVVICDDFNMQIAAFMSYFDAQQWTRIVSSWAYNTKMTYTIKRVYDGEVMNSYRNGWVYTS